MKSVHFKNSEKPTGIKKIKPVKPDAKFTSQIEVEVKDTDGSRCEDSEWIPSRDWHKYLSGQQNDGGCAKSFAWNNCYSKDECPVKNGEEFMLRKPSDKLVDIKLPTVNFCSEERKASPRPQQNMSIADLCDGDKSRIAQMIQELARYKQEKQEDEETILMLKNKVAELKAAMRKLMVNKNSESKIIAKITSQHEIEQLALKNQLSELNQLIYQLQVQKATSEVQLKTIASQAEKLTKIIHEMHRENTDLQIELRVTKERLNAAQNTVEKVSKDLQDIQNNIKPIRPTEDKGCQSVEDFGTGDAKVGKPETSEGTSDDQRILCELFFNKNLQNDFAPKETVIILPSESIPLLSKS